MVDVSHQLACFGRLTAGQVSDFTALLLPYEGIIVKVSRTGSVSHKCQNRSMSILSLSIPSDTVLEPDRRGREHRQTVGRPFSVEDCVIEGFQGLGTRKPKRGGKEGL